jgi:biotin synthase-like enzyme
MLVAEQWDSFARAVLTTGTPLIQRQEMRRAFYAGAAGMFLGILASIAPKNEPTDEDLQMMTGINNELLEFALSVKKGSA